jgi:hypothetical protein
MFFQDDSGNSLEFKVWCLQPVETALQSGVCRPPLFGVARSHPLMTYSRYITAGDDHAGEPVCKVRGGFVTCTVLRPSWPDDGGFYAAPCVPYAGTALYTRRVYMQGQTPLACSSLTTTTRVTSCRTTPACLTCGSMPQAANDTIPLHAHLNKILAH